jgi:hypothetical protein
MFFFRSFCFLYFPLKSPARLPLLEMKGRGYTDGFWSLASGFLSGTAG